MKKIISLAAVIVVLMSCSSSRIETEPVYHRHMQSFYYYPSANVYFDGSCNRYIYNNGGAWITASILPREIIIGNAPRYQVSYNGPEVWRDNQLHRNRYYTNSVRYDNDRREGKRNSRHWDRDRD